MVQQTVLSANASSTYTVVAGDTGELIASKFYTTFSRLESVNPFVNWNNLQIGQVLNLPAAEAYTVVSGDTGEAIARKLGISFSALSAANPSVNWNNLQIGQRLVIPTGNSTTTSPTPIPGTGGAQDDSGTDGGGPVIHYSGPASNFPPQSRWQKWSNMWTHASRVMAINDTPEQIGYIQEAVNTISRESGIDRRVILCTIMQESSGNVHVRTTFGGVRNPGLMQSHNGVEFNQNDQRGSIFQMIRDGTQGTASGDGLTQLYARYGNIYEALRGYNSGSVNRNDLSDGLGATAAYVSDVANR